MPQRNFQKLSLYIGKRSNIRKLLGLALVLSGFLVLSLTYGDYIKAQLDYYITPQKEKSVVTITKEKEVVVVKKEDSEEIKFADSAFGIYIPKIGANAKILSNIDPFDKAVYTAALEKGVAHAKGTALPNENGNTFLFAHSAVDFYEQRKFNVYFYLLNKLSKGDEIFLSYNGLIYEYRVDEVKTVSPSEVEYLNNDKSRNSVTLMTCWPAGFNYKRVIVIAEKVINRQDL